MKYVLRHDCEKKLNILECKKHIKPSQNQKLAVGSLEYKKLIEENLVSVVLSPLFACLLVC